MSKSSGVKSESRYFCRTSRLPVTVRHQPQSFEVKDRILGRLIADRPLLESTSPSSWPRGCSARGTSASRTSFWLISTICSVESWSSATCTDGHAAHEPEEQALAVRNVDDPQRLGERVFERPRARFHRGRSIGTVYV